MSFGVYWDTNVQQDTAYTFDTLTAFDLASDGVSFIDYLLNTTHGDITLVKAFCLVSIKDKYSVKCEVYG